MATYYWNPVADSAWYDGATATWATTDGGTPAIVNPTSADNCYFTATNSHKCTIAATANCLNLTLTMPIMEDWGIMWGY